MKKNLLYLVCLFLFVFLQINNTHAQSSKTSLSKKQKAFVGKWVIKEFDMKVPDNGQSSEEQQMFKAQFEGQKQLMMNKDIFELFADGKMVMYEENKTSKGTWQYDESSNTFITKEDISQKEEKMKVTWNGKTPTITFDESMSTEASEEQMEMGMKIVFGKK